MRFLIIRFSSLGDIIQTTAFAQKLKKRYPGSQIVYATKEEYAELLLNQPYIDEVLPLKKGESIVDFAKRIGKVDYIFDLHVNLRSILLSSLLKAKRKKKVNKHTIYRYALVWYNKTLTNLFKRKTIDNIEDQLALIGANDSNAKPILCVNRKQKRNAIGMAVGAKWKTKMWPKEYFKLLANLLTADGYEVFLFGNAQEKPIADFVACGNKKITSFVGKLSIKETIEHMTSCKVFVSPDSGLMHAAVAIDIPVVAIFGPTVKGFGFFPRGKSIVLETNLRCRPCSLHGTNTCKLGYQRCMYTITPFKVYEAVVGLIK